MNNNTTILKYIAFRWVTSVPGSTKSLFLSNFHNALTLISRGIFYIRLLRIPVLLIISSIKQKLTITLNDEFKPISCAILRLITGTCIIIFMGLFSGAYRGAI